VAATRWTREDERILEAHFERVGASWDGWAALLPDRGPSAIRAKAEKMGLVHRPLAATSQVTRDVSGDVMRMFRNGFAPSRIDADLGIRRGRAHDVIVQEWRYEKEGFGSHMP